jgi:hypothetical protein
VPRDFFSDSSIWNPNIVKKNLALSALRPASQERPVDESPFGCRNVLPPSPFLKLRHVLVFSILLSVLDRERERVDWSEKTEEMVDKYKR